ncbi:LysR family transcriptional regulator [Aquabacterium sp. J223]|uniref:LysR family transcriptional regulator n=1 Tax=Aquabacterium sp. J223 TaxID=2898431 RepID=UPI0021AD8BFB|nr:LysR family transcriptional regulator [Aquabacterium sp. J223]UUX97127.1 LysR family transcriptional regulator [Aquabacterium sp. J223]
MDLVTNLRAFAEVVRSGSFSQAARQLNVVPSVVAKRIAQLEKTTGARLFDRTTRSVRLTEAGEQLLRKVSPLLTEFDEVVTSLQREDGALEGHLRLMAPTTLTMVHLGALLDQFLALHPRLTMEVSLVDRATNPRDGEYDLAISGRAASYDGVEEVPLWPARVLLCAAPAYLAAAGTPTHPRELLQHACLVFKPYGSAWTFRGPRGQTQTLEVQPRFTVDDNRTLLLSCAAGRGLAVLPRYVCAGAIAAGRLVPVLPDWPIPDGWFKAYVPRRRLKVARVNALLQWLKPALDLDAVEAEPDLR